MITKYTFLGIIIATFAFMGLAQAGVLAGFSQITINTGTPGDFDSGTYWSLLWTDTGGVYEYFQAIIEPDDFEDQTGTPSEQTFYVMSQGTNNSCDFHVVGDPYRYIVFTATIEHYDTWPWTCPDNLDSEAWAWVSENCWMGFACQNGIFWDTLWCYRPDEQLAQIGETSNQHITFHTSFIAEAEGKEAEEVMMTNDDSGDGEVTTLGDNVAIYWQGLLSSGDACPITNGHYAAHSNNFPEVWRLIDEGNYISYEDFVKYPGGDFVQYLLWLADGQITEEEAEITWITLANRAVLPDTIPRDVVVTDISFENGRIEIILENLIVYPIFRMFVDADYVELVILQAIPDILNVEVEDFEEGQVQEEPLYVTIKNIADSPGDISVRIIDCYGGFSDGSPQLVPFEAQETKILTFPMYCSSDVNEPWFYGGCTVEAVNMPLPGQGQVVDTMPFSVGCLSMEECIPNHIRCDGNRIVQCVPDGSHEEVIEDCGAQGLICQYIEGEPTCVDPTTEPCQSDADCNDFDVCTEDRCIWVPLGDNYCINEDICGGLPISLEMIILILIPILLAFFGYAVTRFWVWGMVGAIFGAIISIILYILFINWWLLLLGLGITAVIFYLAGGAIMSVAALILVFMLGGGGRR